MRVFVSSTVFDLLDVRAEVGQLLLNVGVSPVLSDDKLSDFQVNPTESSIETCLTNVQSCDEFLIILDRRYGPRLGRFGFDDLSATHLEYRKALEVGLPIHFYIRDRLNADFAVWKRSNRPVDIALPWVRPADFGLFQLIEEHSKLTAGGRSNWCHTFTNSLDLKAALSRRFQSKLLPRRLVEAIEANRFPVLTVETKCTHETINDVPTLKLSSDVTNVGGAPAFNCLLKWDGELDSDGEKVLLAPGQSVAMTYLYAYPPGHGSAEQLLIAQYESPLGVAVSDTFRVGVRVGSNVFMSGSSLVKRRYCRAKEITIEIDE